MASLSLLGTPEPGQQLLPFDGAYRSVPPGPLPVDRSSVSMAEGSFLKGGLNATAVLRSFGMRPGLAEDAAGNNKNTRRPFP